MQAFLISNADFEVLGDSENQIRFQWISNPIDKLWPEDALIKLNNDQLYLLIHGSTKSQREALVSDLNSLNLGALFEEI